MKCCRKSTIVISAKKRSKFDTVVWCIDGREVGM